MVFKPIKTTRVADGVFQQIKASIERGDYKVGEKLPSERTLAEEFDVNRAGVREALRVLEAVGMVEVRQGLGCYAVSNTATEEVPSIWVPWLSVHRDEVLELLDVRECLEVKAAELATHRVTETQLEAMNQVLDQMKVAASDPYATPGDLSQLDVQFHELIAGASRNRVLIELLKQFGSAFETDRYAIFAVPERPIRSIEEHEAVIKAIGSRDPAAAAECMVKHVANIRRTIQTLKMTERGERNREKAKTGEGAPHEPNRSEGQQGSGADHIQGT